MAQTGEVIEEELGVYLLRVSDFDPGTGAFIADIYLQITCDRTCDPQPEIVNGHVLSQTLYEGSTNTYHAWRIRAELEQDVDLRRFPFDEGELPIHIEDGLQDVTQMVYVVDETSDVDSSVSLPSHRLAEGWDARVVEHDYPFFDQTYSRFIFSVAYSSPVPSTIVKDLLPAALIALYGFLSFVMRPDAEASRYVVSTSALIALVFYGANLTGDIPKTDYLTFADKYILLTIFALLLTLGSNIAIANEGRHQSRLDRMAVINRYAGLGTLGLWIVLQGIATLPLII
jgi:hypothetical protein